jgi:hypothetical protein
VNDDVLNEMFLTFASGQHERLGRNSPIGLIDMHIIQEISKSFADLADEHYADKNVFTRYRDENIDLSCGEIKMSGRLPASVYFVEIVVCSHPTAHRFDVEMVDDMVNDKFPHCRISNGGYNMRILGYIEFDINKMLQLFRDLKAFLKREFQCQWQNVPNWSQNPWSVCEHDSWSDCE